MFAQGLITLSLIIGGIWLAWKYIVTPIVDKYYPAEEEPQVDIESLQEKIDLLERRKAELGLLTQTVDVTKSLVDVEDDIEQLSKQLEELEKENT
jgi:hypothetical protein